MRQIFAIMLCLATVACTEQDRAHTRATERASARSPYIPQNDIEFKNYNKRQQIADDPTTIMWCTSAFPIPSSPLFTVPIVGKVTSSGKRAFDTDPGPDGMWGSSSEYDYGFTPTDNLAEWHKMSQFCTNQPTVWQREHTVVTIQIDPALMAAHTAAREALKNNKPKEAMEILSNAISAIKTGEPK